MTEKTIIKPGDPDFYDDVKFESRAHGAIIIDGVETAFTLQCPHCGDHFISRRGSGHRRTFCMGCHAITCGKPECDPCMPFEKRLEMIEKIDRLIQRG